MKKAFIQFSVWHNITQSLKLALMTEGKKLVWGWGWNNSAKKTKSCEFYYLLHPHLQVIGKKKYWNCTSEFGIQHHKKAVSFQKRRKGTEKKKAQPLKDQRRCHNLIMLYVLESKKEHNKHCYSINVRENKQVRSLFHCLPHIHEYDSYIHVYGNFLMGSEGGGHYWSPKLFSEQLLHKPVCKYSHRTEGAMLRREEEREENGRKREMQNWQAGGHRNVVPCSSHYPPFHWEPTTPLLQPHPTRWFLLYVINYHICSLLEKIPESLVVVAKQEEQQCTHSQLHCCCTSNCSQLWFRVSADALM